MKGNCLDPRRLQCTLCALLTILIISGNVTSAKAEDVGSPTATPLSIPDKDSLRNATSLSAAFRKAAETIRPAIVSIRANQQAYAAIPSAKSILPDSWHSYFGYALSQIDAFHQTRGPLIGPQPIPQQCGTGVIVSREGYVLTNCDVVAGATQFIVKTQTNIEYPAKVARKDTKAGLAVLKIEGPDLPAAKLADFDETRIGDWVLAIGGSSDPPVSAGIVSAISKDAGNGIGQATSLHTDALISPANHGGPLVNLQGEVVGINVFKAAHGGESRDFGVAIPSSLAQRMLDSLVPVRAIASRAPSAQRSWSEEVIELINHAGKAAYLADVNTGMAKSEWQDQFRGLASRFNTLFTELSQGQKRVERTSVNGTGGSGSRVDVKFSPRFSKSGTSEN